MYSTKFPEHVTESPEKNWSVKSAAIKVLLNDFCIKKYTQMFLETRPIFAILVH